MMQIDPDDIQQISVDAGAVVLENGGETYRAEDMVMKTAQSLGAADASSFVTPTVVMVSFKDKNGCHHSYFRRIYSRTINLKKLVRINNLSRALERRGTVSDCGMLKHRVERIASSAEYSPAVITAAASLSSAFFTRMFGGSPADAACALGIGALLRIVLLLLGKSTLNSFFISILSGTIISVLADLISLTPLGINSSIVMIGVLMQVVPGLALVNAMRDIIAGDFMAGNARLTDAIMTALGLSVGSAAGVLLFKAVHV